MSRVNQLTPLDIFVDFLFYAEVNRTNRTEEALRRGGFCVHKCLLDWKYNLKSIEMLRKCL